MIIVIADKDRVYLIHEDSSMFQAQCHQREEAAAEGLKRTAFDFNNNFHIDYGFNILENGNFSFVILSSTPAIAKPFITISFTELFHRWKKSR